MASVNQELGDQARLADLSPAAKQNDFTPGACGE